MIKKNTKQEILNMALNLFSTHGYEATSILQIADAVGIRKASLYSHFNSKQEILDAIINNVLEQYNHHSIFAVAAWDNPSFTNDKLNMRVDDAVQMILSHVHYILHDPQIVQSRKLLTIEQFQNVKLKNLQTKMNYTDVLNYFKGFIRFLIDHKKLKNGDVEIMASQLCLPISVWINLCDREPDREEEVLKLIKRHIQEFFNIYEFKNND